MATAIGLSTVLTQDEIHNLNETVRHKLEALLKQNEGELSTLKIQHVKLQTQSEQRCFELDTKLQRHEEKEKKEEVIIQELSTAKDRLDTDLASSKDQQRAQEIKVSLLESTLRELQREKDAFLTEKEDLSSLLARRNDDLDRLTAELKSLTDQLVNASKEKSEFLIKSEELDGKLLALEYKEKRLDQERELQVRQARLLQDELDQRTKDLMAVRREKTSKLLELQADLAEKIEELRIAQRSSSELAASNQAHEKHIQDLNEKLRELGEDETKMFENSRNEVRSQARLIELYKTSSEDAQSKAEELTKVAEELQRLLHDASDRYGELETNSKSQTDELKEQLEKSSSTIAQIKKELEHANNLLDVSKSRVVMEENLEAMSPSAAAASRLLKSGMTLTQIYSQYVSISEQLLMKEEENKRLNNYIDQILQEIEERAPAFTRQRDDFEKSVEMVSNLSRQLDLAAEEADTERENANEARRILAQTQRSSQRFEKQVTDLSKQVCFLLREIEELKGNRIPDGPSMTGDHEVSSSEGSAAAVISRHLVTFQDIEVIQQRNQMLLVALRAVSEKEEASEKNAVDARTAHIQQSLETALAEIEHQRDTRRRHEELVKSVIQQRDTYRTLLQDAGLSELQTPVKSSHEMLTSTPALAPKRDDQRSLSDLEKLLNDTKKCLEQQELTYRNLMAEKKDGDKALQSKIQTLEDSLTEVRAQNIRLSSQLQYTNEKEKLLQGNLDSLKKQLVALEDKNKIYACTVAKHEQSIVILRDEAMGVQQKLARAEVVQTMLQEEKQLLRDAEQRLLLERDSLLNDRRSQSLLHVNLESIKLSLERGESETRMRLQNTVASLEQQLELLRKKLGMEEERFRTTVKTFEEQVASDEAKLKETEERAVKAETEASALQERLTAAETQPHLKTQVTRLLSTNPSTPESEQLSELRTQLVESRTQLDVAKEQLELVRQQAEQYRAISDSMEEELKKSGEASQLFKQQNQQQLLQMTNERNSLKTNLEQAEEKLKKLEEGAVRLGQASADQSEEILMKAQRLEVELSSALAKSKEAEGAASKAREEFLEQAKQTKEAQEKYERELMQHAADVEQLNVVREQMEQGRAKLASDEEKIARLEQELVSARTSWITQKEMLAKESAEKTLRCAELDKEVDIMQQQIVTLSTRMEALSRVQERPVKSGDEKDGAGGAGALNVSLGEEETRSSDQLLELIRFLRREKEITISRFEVSEAENQRLKTRVEQAERQLADAQAEIKQDRERTATSSLTSSKHTELLRKLETLNALTDSNRILREERGNLTTRVEEMSAKLTALQVEVEPLRGTNTRLSDKVDELTAENQTLRKQMMAWKNRTSVLQERVGRGTVDDLKRLQQEKEQLQKLLDATKEAQSKTATMLTETQRINTQLVGNQQKLQEEVRKAKEEAAKLQTDLTAAETKNQDDTKVANEQANQLRRIARKYKTQAEEMKKEDDALKADHEKLTSEHNALIASSAEAAAAAAAAIAAASIMSSTTGSAEASSQALQERTQELEGRIALLTAEIEQSKSENLALRSAEAKLKAIMKNVRQKLMESSNEKDTLTKELTETKAKMETLERSSEENSVREAALRSQTDARMNRLERENNDLAQTKQALETDMEALNQRLVVYQRQLELYQKQQQHQKQQQQQKQQQLQQQQQQQQQLALQSAKASTSVDKIIQETTPPTANIKPMASSAVTGAQRPSVSSSPGQSPSGLGQTHGSTPTASIRPMAMTSRTIAVSPMARPVTLSSTPAVVPISSTHSMTTLPSAPIAATSAPVAATSAPVAATSAPVAATSAPVAATSAPVAAISAPVAATSAPVAATSVPVAATSASVAMSSAPVAPAASTSSWEGEPSTSAESSSVGDGRPSKRSREVEELAAVPVKKLRTLAQAEEEAAEVQEDVVEIEDVDLVGEEEEEDEILVECDEEAVETMEGEEEDDDVVEVEVEEPREEDANTADVEPLEIDEDSNVNLDVPAPTEEAQLEQDVAEEMIESETFAAATSSQSGSAVPSPNVPVVLRPPPREDVRLPSFGRTTLAYEDGGDDGIVPSTPVLLRPRTNDGFAEAVSSPQVNTRFVFAAVPDFSVPAGSAALSHLESQSMEDTRMDLSQLEESAGRSVAHEQPSFVEAAPGSPSSAMAAVVAAASEVTAIEEQGDFEGGPDLEGDADAEYDLLGEEDPEPREADQQLGAVPSTVTPAGAPISEQSAAEKNQDAPLSFAEVAGPSSSSPQPARLPLRRGASPGVRGRGDSRVPLNRPVPITWSPGPTDPASSTVPARMIRRNPIAVPTPLVPGSAPAVTEPGAHPVVRGRGGRGRLARHRGRRM